MNSDTFSFAGSVCIRAVVCWSKMQLRAKARIAHLGSRWVSLHVHLGGKYRG